MSVENIHIDEIKNIVKQMNEKLGLLVHVLESDSFEKTSVFFHYCDHLLDQADTDIDLIVEQIQELIKGGNNVSS